MCMVRATDFLQLTADGRPVDDSSWSEFSERVSRGLLWQPFTLRIKATSHGICQVADFVRRDRDGAAYLATLDNPYVTVQLLPTWSGHPNAALLRSLQEGLESIRGDRRLALRRVRITL